MSKNGGQIKESRENKELNKKSETKGSYSLLQIN